MSYPTDGHGRTDKVIFGGCFAPENSIEYLIKTLVSYSFEQVKKIYGNATNVTRQTNGAIGCGYYVSELVVSEAASKTVTLIF